ncbi:hypothetical protein OZN62_02400 [Aurantiacibacter sp. MUD11]|uniref:hypothetical protein n=1 Tax=Aurantiacibacter sp. MUD11 TaxID=3003265 RepID=UPI0022AADA69|nr:hypothetical protein [Aurantiacibacter sp. MUD11]WAT18451.1 hypothetical protein OZN62_02400 [Aurantiacibacter sp. MUD11]
MRACLISLPESGGQALPSIAGKSLARRQLMFAREAGCTSVIAFGGGASADAIDLRHAAERSGMKYQVISTSHALPGIIGDEDSLLVLQPGLLPESRAALDLLRAEGDRVLVVSAGPGVTAGLERIDLDRAWAGALTMPGRWLGKLTGLPEDIAPHGALLRIALQHRLPEARLADSTLDEGRWSVITTSEAARIRAAEWQRTHLGETSPGAMSRWLGRGLVTGPGSGLLDKRYARPAILAVVAALLGGGIAGGFYEMPILGFALVAAAVPVLEAFIAISRLGVAPFGKLKRWPWLRRAIDAAILALGIMAIDSLLHRAIFPPLVLGAALLLLDRRQLPSWLEPARDRMLVAGLVAIVAALATPELAIMLAGILVLLANIAPDRG